MQVTVPEAARLLRVSEHTVRRRLRSGELQGRQVASSGGFAWMVEIPEEIQGDGPDSREMAAMKALVSRLEAQVEAQQEQLTAKDKQIEQLHVLLQQAQAALPAPRDGRPWWKWWGRR
jgi:DeoR/GlpR family transcriptional regulator of sugar metabolism